MKKNIFIIQNTEIWWHLALSIFLTNLLWFYDNKKYNLNLICWKIDNEDEIKDIKNNFNIFVLNTWLYKISDNIRFAYNTLKILIKENKRQNIDILHCFYPNSSLMWIFFFKIFFNRKVKVIYDIRSPWIEMSFFNNHLSKNKWLIKNIMHLSEYFLIRQVDYFVFITKWLKDYYNTKYNLNLNNNFSIIPTWVNVQKFNIELNNIDKNTILNELNINNNEVIIWYVWTLNKLRELSNFIQNNIEWIKNENIKFIFIWEWDDKGKIEKIIVENNIDDKFIFLWKMPQSDLIKYIQVFDYWLAHIPKLFIFENSFPLKILEYLASWKKILATDLKAHLEIQKDFEREVIIYKDKIVFSELKKEKNHDLNNKIYNYDWNSLYGKYWVIYEKLV